MTNITRPCPVTLSSVLLFAALVASATGCSNDTALGGGGRSVQDQADSHKAATPAGETDPSDRTAKEPAPGEPAPPGAPGLATVPCEQLNNGAVLVKRPSTGQLVVTGDICLESPPPVEIALIVDVSGSMLTADPQRGGTCGRAAAVNALLEQVPGTAKVSLVTFSDHAKVAVKRQAKQDLNLSELTRLACAIEFETNYKAAFDATAQLLAGVEQPFVYLISDGLPRVTGKRQSVAAAEGQQAAAALRALNGLTLHAVYLGASDIQSEAGKYLVEITGSAARVRVVAEADELTGAILDLDVPTSLSRKAVTLHLTPASGETRTAALEKLEMTGDNTWSFTSETVELAVAPGAEIQAELRLAGRTEALGTVSLRIVE